MVNKKISGQTIAIIILAILLLIAIGFGGVYAYYSARSKKMTGTVIMANLNINLSSYEYGTKSATSQIVISHGTNFVPGQNLKNSQLNIINKSAEEVPVYLIVVYEITANKMDEHQQLTNEIIYDSMQEPLIDFGAEYINEKANINYAGTNADWVDYVFTYGTGEDEKQYRCIVSKYSWQKPKGETSQTIPVIYENQLKLHRFMGDVYQRTSLTFAFQAYAISANSFAFETGITQAQRCNEIISAIYESVEYQFFDGTVSNPTNPANPTE